MKIIVRDNRATLLSSNGLIDINDQSKGDYSSQIEDIYPRWNEFVKWAKPYGSSEIEMEHLSALHLGSVSPVPQQVLAVGLNYVDHATESGFKVPEWPIVFTKFQSSITGPFGELTLTSKTVDWEVELVVVIGASGRNIPAEDAWEHIAGVTIGQDYSDRDAQFRGQPSQFSLGKSFAGFTPIGPVLVTPDEFHSLPDPVVQCAIDEQVVQHAPLSDMVFSIPDLIAKMSTVVELLPGDVLFTGTPPGVGFGREPKRYLRRGERVRSSITGLGFMEQICM